MLGMTAEQRLFTLVVAPLLVILGAIGYRLALGVSLWRMRREPAHGWAVVWCATALTFVGGRLLQRAAMASDTAVTVGVVLQYAGVLSLMSSSLAVAHIVAGQPLPRGYVGRAGSITALSVATVCGWLVVQHGRLTTTVDAFGVPLAALHLGPAAAVLVPAILWFTHRSARALGGSTDAEARGPLVAAGVVLALLALNDVLLATGFVRTVQLGQFGILGILLVGGHLLADRIDRKQQRLTADLARALDEVRRGEARFRTLAEATVEGVLVHDGARVTDANAAVSRMTGRELETLRGRALRELFDAADAEALERLVEGGKGGSIRVHGARSDGTTFPAQVCATRATRDGAPAVLTVIDTSERDALDRRMLLAERMMSLGTLAAGAAHEINNPLAYMTMNLQLIDEAAREGRLGDPQGPAVQDVLSLLSESQAGCERVRRVVADMQIFSRPGPSSEPLRSAVDLEAVARTAVKMTSYLVRHRARLVERYEPVLVEGDEARLTQVLVNLIINAAHAIPEGPAAEQTIELTVVRAGTSALLEVRDTGSGISPEVLPRIFDPFFTTKPVGVGTGLGLWICHSVVTSLQGEIGVRSTPGQGTTFRITLPALAS